MSRFGGSHAPIGEEGSSDRLTLVVRHTQDAISLLRSIRRTDTP